jgi:membrane protein implicated in regulation of membrane protease activity
MTWATFYLVCFVLGFAFTLISLLSGIGHLHVPVKWHVFHGGVHSPATGASPTVGSAIRGGGGGTAPTQSQVAPGRSGSVGPVNSFTIMAFLTWFGGTGLLLAEYSKVWFAIALLLASLSGVAGSAVVFTFLTRVALAHDGSLEAEVSQMVGVLGRLTVSVRPGGTGEIVYSQGGTRHTCGARAEDSTAIPKGSEVVVTRYERGIAYVRPWDDMAQ